jgi:hypothetical protein
MYVMPASMHHAWVAGFIWDLVFFLYGQSVYICPQGYDSGTRFLSFYLSHYTGSSHYLERDARFFKLLPDELGCLKFLVAQFRMHVQMMPDGHSVFREFPGQALDFLT